MRRSSRIALSMAAGLAVLAVFIALVGVETLLRTFAAADPSLLALSLVGALASMVCWSEAFRWLLGTDGTDASHWDFFVLYSASVFPKNVLPAGHATGPVITSYVISRRLGRAYTPTLALMSLGEVLSLLSSVVLSVVGLAGIAVFVPGTPGSRAIMLALFGTLLGLGLLGAVVWLRQDLLAGGVAGLAYLGRTTVGRLSTRVRRVLAPGRVARGVEQFFGTMRVAGDQRVTMALVLGLSVVGWLGFVVSLLAGMAAVGHPVSPWVAAFLVPASGLVGALPLPGGIGGVEVAMAAALVSLSGVPLSAALAGTLVYRLATYWAVTLLSGLAAVAVSLDPGELTPPEGEEQL